jgi:hypothetical protein
MKVRTFTAWLFGLAVVGGLVIAPRPSSAGEKKIDLEQVPAAVKATILAEGGKIQDIERQKGEAGKVIFEADVIKDGKEIELRIAEDGKLVSRKVEGDAKGEEEDEGAKEDSDEEEDAEEDGAADEGGEESVEDKKAGTEELEDKVSSAAWDKLAEAKVTLAEAIETALAQVPGGKAYLAVFKPEQGKPRYEIQVIAGDRRVEVAIDGETRKVIEVEPKGGRPAAAATKGGVFRDSFEVDKADLVPTGKNDYFSLVPGDKLAFKAGKVTLTITVLDETKLVDGVTTRVIEEREEKDGKPLEISRNFFAIDRKTKDVYYFGEEVDEFEDGRLISHEGAWISGVKGARFGLLIPARPKVGDKFYQEIAPEEAMDRAEIVGLDEEVKTPAGTFRCIHVKETSPIERGVSHKWFAPGVGLVKDDEFVLAEAPKARP